MTNHSPVESLPVVTYNSLPVITTELLAKLYNTEPKYIQTNTARNESRFIAGKHFFKLEGAELKDFKNRPSLRGLVGSRARSLVLWTERGAARHAKMLETDQAWEVFEKLEDFYFSQKEKAEQVRKNRQCTATQLIPLRQTAERLIATGVGNIYPDIWKYVHKEFGVEHINELLPEQIPQAISFLDALEGEYLPKQHLPQVGLESLTMPMSFFDEFDWLFDLEGVDKAESLSKFYRYPQKMLKNMAEYPNPLIKMLTKLRSMGVNIDAAYFWLKALQHHYEVNTSNLNRKERQLSDILLSNTSVAHNIIKSIIDEWRNTLAPAIKTLNPNLESEVSKQLSELNGVVYCNLLTLKGKPEAKLLA
ncbi:ORF6N domain-containing protein [Providencia alcalifaciens]|nr:ORF6N domain-containing protein [Providencia alcalifaciens]NYS91901.1 ORF6N domain-containing protein [Providencia alcalifaciens]